MMVAMKASRKSVRVLNELIFVPRARRGGPVRVTVENASPEDTAFLEAVAKLIAIWVSRTWRW